ncbi:hypothetical protein [Halorientalis sp.]|jgi:hypothetical protein|uniref:hypothetical protein n=1 Tax=Halorientalis sp. TaxID=1931229 RepID=UPI002629363E|nr:hypothetical protein [Halorientalis sp.]
MQRDSRADSGWEFVAEHDSVATIIDTLLDLDTDETYTRSELADETGIALKTLHLMDDVDGVVELGMLDKHHPEDEEIYYTLNADSSVLEAAREFERAAERTR